MIISPVKTGGEAGQHEFPVVQRHSLLLRPLLRLHRALGERLDKLSIEEL